MRSTFAIIGFVAVLGATPALAGWQDVASQYDQQRLSRLSEARAKALEQAESGAPAQDLAIIHAVVGARGEGVTAESILGAWRCRTIKLGGMTPDVIYSWFRCRIALRGGHPYLQKLTGSQHMNGYLYPGENGTLVYLGASSVTGEPPHAYSGNGASAGAPATPDDQIGRLSRIGEGHLRLEMPFPVQESTMDVLELKR